MKHLKRSPLDFDLPVINTCSGRRYKHATKTVNSLICIDTTLNNICKASCVQMPMISCLESTCMHRLWCGLWLNWCGNLDAFLIILNGYKTQFVCINKVTKEEHWSFIALCLMFGSTLFIHGQYWDLWRAESTQIGTSKNGKKKKTDVWMFAGWVYNYRVLPKDWAISLFGLKWK